MTDANHNGSTVDGVSIGGDTDTVDTVDDDIIMTMIPLQTRIIQIVKSCPNYTIRPARLARELGFSLSVNDASAELCGLLKAVGEGSSFHFETTSNDTDTDNAIHTMVFTFPPDFEAKAIRSQRVEDWKQSVWETIRVIIKICKVLTAFGLIVSTVIVSIAGMVALVAAIVAMSRGGGNHNRGGGGAHHLSRQLRNLFVMVRQLLWCYAMFGNPMDDENNNQDPFFREAAYDTSLVLGICCGNPASIWFWYRAGHLRRRRRRMARGWGRARGMFGNNGNNNNNGYSMNSSANNAYSSYYDDAPGLEGVRLIRRGDRGQRDEVLPVPSRTLETEHRGLLSIAVEFLFGPNTLPTPSEADKWRLRSAVILEKSSSSSSSSSQQHVSLCDLMPYVDSPPASLQTDNTATIVSEGLLIVTHFNGVPASKKKSDNDNENDIAKAAFVFPELLAESTMRMTYDDPTILQTTPATIVDADKNKWKGLFYLPSDNNNNSSSSSGSTTTGSTSGFASSGRTLGGGGTTSRTVAPTPTTTTTTTTTSSSISPPFLYESPMTFTELTAKEFYRCLVVAILNLIGVIWFAKSLQVGGILEGFLNANIVKALQWGLIPMLQFYAKLFFVIPTIRLLYVIFQNEVLCRRRNKRRWALSEELVKEKENERAGGDNTTAETGSSHKTEQVGGGGGGMEATVGTTSDLL